MKKIILFFLILVSLSAYSQDNVIKIGISGVGYGDFALNYERVITPHSAMNLTVGYLNPNASLIDFDNLFSSSGGVELNKLKSGFHASVDYKFYVGKKLAPRGFYVAPYLRYFHYSMLLNDEIGGDLFDVNTTISSVGLGFQIGYHWVVYDRISIDWYFFGVGAEYLIPKLVYTTDKNNFDYSTIVGDVREVFTGWDYFEKRLKTNPSADNMTAKLPTFFPGIKTGLTIGFAF